MMSLVKLKKGDSVNVYMFTGCFSATKVISEATKDTLTVTRNASYGTLTEMIFDKATGKQMNAKNPQFGNFVRLVEDESPVKAKKPAKPVKEDAKVKTKEPIVAKAAAKTAKPAKAVKPPVEVDMDDEEDGYEEV